MLKNVELAGRIIGAAIAVHKELFRFQFLSS